MARYMHPDQWSAIASTLEAGDVIAVDYETVSSYSSERVVSKEMELTSKYKGWWRGNGTDGANQWRYTTIWLGEQTLAGDRTVVLKYHKSNGQRDGIYGKVVDIRRPGDQAGGDFDFTGGGV